MGRFALVSLAAMLPLLAVGSSAADTFTEAKQRRLTDCRAIPAGEYSTGMIFNSEGYKTLYHRSRCIQNIAIEERDVSLCSEVRERKSWFFDGSATSPGNCRKLVGERMAGDRAEAAPKDFTTIHRLVSAEAFLNGNGRDFDLLIATDGSFYGSYLIEVAVSSKGGPNSVPVFSQVYTYGEPGGPRWLLLYRDMLIEQIGEAGLGGDSTLRVALALQRTPSNRFWYDRIPVELRQSRLEISVRFSELKRARTP